MLTYAGAGLLPVACCAPSAAQGAACSHHRYRPLIYVQRSSYIPASALIYLQRSCYIRASALIYLLGSCYIRESALIYLHGSSYAAQLLHTCISSYIPAWQLGSVLQASISSCLFKRMCLMPRSTLQHALEGAIPTASLGVHIDCFVFKRMCLMCP
jgi:hypothetical protein